MKRIFARADLVLLAVLILLLAGAWLLRGKASGQTVSLRVDGKEVARLDLSRDQDYPVEGPYGRNLVRIRDGYAFVAEADCPNGDCMRGRISRSGESLACLPHHLTLVAEGEDGLDAVSGQ